MIYLNPLLSACGLSLLMSLFVMVISLTLAYAARNWIATLKELFDASI